MSRYATTSKLRDRSLSFDGKKVYTQRMLRYATTSKLRDRSLSFDGKKCTHKVYTQRMSRHDTLTFYELSLYKLTDYSM